MSHAQAQHFNDSTASNLGASSTSTQAPPPLPSDNNQSSPASSSPVIIGGKQAGSPTHPGAFTYAFNVSYANSSNGGNGSVARSSTNINGVPAPLHGLSLPDASPISSPNSATSSLGGSGMGVAEKSDEEMARLHEAMIRMMSSDSIAGIPSPGHAMPSPDVPKNYAVGVAAVGADNNNKPEFPAIPPDDVLAQSDPDLGGNAQQRNRPPHHHQPEYHQQQFYLQQRNFQPIVAPQRAVPVGGDEQQGAGGVVNNRQAGAGGGAIVAPAFQPAVVAVALPPPPTPPPVYQFGEREFYGYGVSGRWGRDRGTHLFTQLTLTDGTKVFCNSLRLRVKPEWFDSIQTHQTQFEVFFHAAPNFNHANRMLTCLDAWPSNCLVDVIGLTYTPQIGFLDVTSGLINKLMHGAPLVMCAHMLDPHRCPNGVRCTQGHIRPIWLDHHNSGTAAAIASSQGQSTQQQQQQQAHTATGNAAAPADGGQLKPTTATGTTGSGTTIVGGLIVSTGEPRRSPALKPSTPGGAGSVTPPGGATPPLTPRAAAAAQAAQSAVSVLVINGITFSPPMRWSLGGAATAAAAASGGGAAGAAAAAGGSYQLATSISYRLEEWARADASRRICGHGVTSGWQLDSKGVPYTFVEMAPSAARGERPSAFPLVVFMTCGRLVGGQEAAMAGMLQRETPPFEVFCMAVPNLRDPTRMTVDHGCASEATRVRVLSPQTGTSDMVPVSLLEYTEGLLAVLLAEPGTAPYPPFAWCKDDNGADAFCPQGTACRMAHRRRGTLVVG